MAEINSKQAALIASGKKAYQSADNGRERVLVMTLPAVYSALNVADTVASGLLIPVGSRIIGATVSNGTGSASQTISVGIRDARTKAVVDATAIVNAQAVTTATGAPVSCGNGTKIAAGIDYVTPQDVEPYLTVGGAASPANQPLIVTIRTIGA